MPLLPYSLLADKIITDQQKLLQLNFLVYRAGFSVLAIQLKTLSFFLTWFAHFCENKLSYQIF